MTPRVVAIILCMLGFVCGLSSCEELERTANSDRQPHTYEGAPLEAIERHPGEPLFGISSFPGGFSAAEQEAQIELNAFMASGVMVADPRLTAMATIGGNIDRKSVV